MDNLNEIVVAARNLLHLMEHPELYTQEEIDSAAEILREAVGDD